MSNKHLLVIRKPSGIDVYFRGEQPGDSADPRCSELEDKVIGYIDNHWDKGYPTPSNEDLLWFMTVHTDRIFSEIEEHERTITVLDTDNP